MASGESKRKRTRRVNAATRDIGIQDDMDAVALAAARDLPNAGAVFVRVNGPDSEWFEDDLRL